MGKTFDNILEKAVDYIGVANHSEFLNYLHNYMMECRLAVKNLHPFTMKRDGSSERVLIEPSAANQYLSQVETARSIWIAIRSSYVAYQQSPHSSGASLLNRFLGQFYQLYKEDQTKHNFSNSSYLFSYDKVIQMSGRMSEQERKQKLQEIFS